MGYSDSRGLHTENKNTQDSMWPAKPETFPTWPFTESLLTPPTVLMWPELRQTAQQ